MAPKSRRSTKSIPSCKHGMKSQCHTGIKLAPVRVFTCKHPLKELLFHFPFSMFCRPLGAKINLPHAPMNQNVYCNITATPEGIKDTYNASLFFRLNPRRRTKATAVGNNFITCDLKWKSGGVYMIPARLHSSTSSLRFPLAALYSFT